MPTYVLLGHLTQKGIGTIKEAPARIEAWRKSLQALGARQKEWYLLMGRYDVMSIIEAPNDEVVAKAVLALGGLGNLSTETLRAFSEDEFKKLAATL